MSDLLSLSTMSDLVARGWSLQRGSRPYVGLVVLLLACQGVQWSSASGTTLSITAERLWIAKGDNYDVKCESPPLHWGGFLSLMRERPGQEKLDELARVSSLGHSYKVSYDPSWVQTSGGSGGNAGYLLATVRMGSDKESRYFCVYKAASNTNKTTLGPVTVLSLHELEPNSSASRSVALTGHGSSENATSSVSRNAAPSPALQGEVAWLTAALIWVSIVLGVLVLGLAGLLVILCRRLRRAR